MVTYHEWYLQHRQLVWERVSQSSQSHGTAQSISLVIAVQAAELSSAATMLQNCLQSATNQIVPPKEIVVVCSGSIDPATLAEIRSLGQRVRIVSAEKKLNLGEAYNLGASVSTGDHIFFIEGKDQLPSFAIAEVSRAIEHRPDVDLLYGDENSLDSAGRFTEPFFKPDWSPEHLQSTMYLRHSVVIRRELFGEVQGFRAEYVEVPAYDLVLRASLKARRIEHIREVIYHSHKSTVESVPQTDSTAEAKLALADFMTSQGKEAEIQDGYLPGTLRPRFKIKGHPLVSIVMPTDCRSREIPGRGAVNLVVNAVKSILDKSTYKNIEIVVADNANCPPQTVAILKDLGVKFVSYQQRHEKFNLSDKLNWAGSHATGEFILALNDDIEIITQDWIEAMVELAQQEDIGVVGARLLYPDESIQHAGVVFVNGNQSMHAFHGLSGRDPAHDGYALMIRNYLALTGACIMVKASLWKQLEGFDTAFAIDFNDTDFCLKAYARGLRNVYTPFAQLFHFDQSTLSQRVQSESERNEFFRRWGNVIATDPYLTDPGVRFIDCKNPY